MPGRHSVEERCEWPAPPSKVYLLEVRDCRASFDYLDLGDRPFSTPEWLIRPVRPPHSVGADLHGPQWIVPRALDSKTTIIPGEGMGTCSEIVGTQTVGNTVLHKLLFTGSNCGRDSSGSAEL